MTDSLKIFGMNVRGLSNRPKRRDVFHWLRSKRMSIYCLVDIHVDDKIYDVFTLDWGAECVISSFSSNSRGVAILFSHNLEYKVLEVERDNIGNMLIVKLCCLFPLLELCIQGYG